MAYLLLAAAQVIGILLIPFGLPGLWLQVGAVAAYAWFTHFATIGAVPILLALALALLAEIAEFLLGSRYARAYGGGRRAAWGALVGGIVGAVVGLPIPVLGSVVGAFLGSFAGAALFEFTRGRGGRSALRAGWGALLGRLVSTALKIAIGVAVAALALLTALG